LLSMSVVTTLDVASWQPSLDERARRDAVLALESGGIIALSRVRFELTDGERRFLSAQWSDGRSKA
jgi:hypothetical protein